MLTDTNVESYQQFCHLQHICEIHPENERGNLWQIQCGLEFLASFWVYWLAKERVRRGHFNASCLHTKNLLLFLCKPPLPSPYGWQGSFNHFDFSWRWPGHVFGEKRKHFLSLFSGRIFLLLPLFSLPSLESKCQPAWERRKRVGDGEGKREVQSAGRKALKTYMMTHFPHSIWWAIEKQDDILQ